jgi:predicted CoA-binding protein
MKELVEAMAQSIWECGDPDVFSRADANTFAQAALAAIEAQGMMVVPVEPSEAMTWAGAEHLNDIGSETDVADIYRAMLAASPRGGA